MPLMVTLIAAYACAFPAQSVAQAPPGDDSSVVPGAAAPELAAQATDLANRATQYWRGVQRIDGRFPDPVAGSGGDYGTAMLGLAMARRGLAAGDGALLQAGLSGLTSAVERPVGGSFEPLVLAEAYRWGQANLPSSAIGAGPWSVLEPQLRNDLLGRRSPVTGAAARCLAIPSCWINLKLVGALSSLQLLGTGLRSTTPGALLADPDLGKRTLTDLGVRVPIRTDSAVTRTGGAQIEEGGILSDPPRNPLAYHALSAAFLGRAVDELGDGTPPRTVAALDRTTRALLALAAPDGDLSWFGRGQGQVWVRAVAAEAAARAARRAPGGSPTRGRALALVERELAFLRTQQVAATGAFELVPGASTGDVLKARGIDSYATMRGYNGLAVDALDRIPALLAGIEGAASRLPASRDGAVRAPEQAGIAALTRGGTWVALAGRSRAKADARYGSGILALQTRDASGTWRAQVPGRPLSGAGVATLALQIRGAHYPMAGHLRSERSSKGVQITGGWGTPGAAIVDAGTTWRWSLTPSGAVVVTFRMQRARTLAVQALVGDGAKARDTPSGTVVDGRAGTRIEYALRAGTRALTIRKSRRPVGASAYDRAIRAVTMLADVRAGEQITLTVTPRR